MKESAALTVHLPIDLMRRAKAIGKTTRTQVSQLIRDGLAHRVKELEEEQRRLAAAAEADRAAAALKRTVRRVVGGALQTKSLAPMPLATQARTSAVEPGVVDPMDKLYRSLAHTILAVEKNPDEVLKRAQLAVEAIRRERPLTSPREDGPILTMLENYVLRLREEGISPDRTYDTFVGAVIDVSRVKTAGASEKE